MMEATTQEVDVKEIEKLAFDIASGMNMKELQREIDSRIDIVLLNPDDEIAKIEAKVFAQTLLRRT